MCLFPKPETPEAPELPPETQAMKQPEAAAVRETVGKTTAAGAQAGANTILTSGSGVTEAAPTEKKTLLGQ